VVEPGAASAARLIGGGRYELETLIGRGGIAEVWRARHVALNSSVAIKFLQGASAQRESTRRRFTTEAQVTAQLKSRNAVQVFDFGVTDDGQPYLVMELLEGETLGRRIERAGKLTLEETARLLGQCAKALQRAHQIGIVHRDFKPDNVIIGVDDDGNDFVKVLDFGIAKLVGELEMDDATEDSGLESSGPRSAGKTLADKTFTTFTKTGSVLGTPFYMAPEQIRRASDVDLRADIWAFGVVAYECLTGRPPFEGDNLVELFKRIETSNHPDACALDPNIPEGFRDWFNIACAHVPQHRFPNAMVAWRRLVLALNATAFATDVEDSLNVSGVNKSGSASTSGERRVVVVPASSRQVDEGAATHQMSPASVGAIESRSAEGSKQMRGLRRISVPAPPLASDEASTPPAQEVTAVTGDAGRRRSGLTIASAIALLAIIGTLAFVRLRSTSTPAATVETAQPSTSGVIDEAPATTTPPSQDRQASAGSDDTPAVAARSAPSASASHAPKPHATVAAPATTGAPISAPTAITIAAPPPQPTTPPAATTPKPPASAAIVDPGSYR
jgi:serine/threonine-protein kinase